MTSQLTIPQKRRSFRDAIADQVASERHHMTGKLRISFIGEYVDRNVEFVSRLVMPGYREEGIPYRVEIGDFFRFICFHCDRIDDCSDRPLHPPVVQFQSEDHVAELGVLPIPARGLQVGISNVDAVGSYLMRNKGLLNCPVYRRDHQIPYVSDRTYMLRYPYDPNVQE
jgi:hypothetical protein